MTAQEALKIITFMFDWIPTEYEDEYTEAVKTLTNVISNRLTCRDCKYCKVFRLFNRPLCECQYADSRSRDRYHALDYYCADGKRKDES